MRGGRTAGKTLEVLPRSVPMFLKFLFRLSLKHLPHHRSLETFHTLSASPPRLVVCSSSFVLTNKFLVGVFKVAFETSESYFVVRRSSKGGAWFSRAPFYPYNILLRYGRLRGSDWRTGFRGFSWLSGQFFSRTPMPPLKDAALLTFLNF